MKIKLEDVVYNLREGMRNRYSHIFLAEDLNGKTIKVNPHLYKQMIGIKFNGKDVYRRVEK